MSFMQGGRSGKKQVVQISVLKPPPPPPPPPPQEKIPEPETPKEEVKIPEPEQPQPAQDEAPPPGEQLDLDADASGTGDAFGLGAKKGGTDITKLGTGTGTGGLGRDRAAWFGGLVQSHLQAQLSKIEKLRNSDYRIQMRIWFAADGKVERFELVDSTGDKSLDDAIRVAMEKVAPMRQAPPQDLPQPIRLRVTSRMPG
jgi:protein TonB